MPILSAENNFKKGLVALVDDDAGTAVDWFRRALQIDRQRNFQRPEWRYLSYYGLSMATATTPNREAIEACRTAAFREAYNADLFLNLARVYRLAGQTTQALESVVRGLEIDPGHRALRAELAGLDRRSALPLRGLHRDHPLNRWLGTTRAGLRRRLPAWLRRT